MPDIKGRLVRTRLAYKVYAIVLVSIFFCAVVIGMSNYYDNKKMLSTNIGSGLKKIAQTAALGIDADRLSSIKSFEDLFYIRIRDYLLKVKRQNEIGPPIYILKRKSTNKASMLVTTEPSFLLGAEYRLNPTMKEVFSTGKSDFSPMYTDHSGTWISAYAPIKSSTGSMLGVLELNQEVGYYMTQLRLRLIRIIVLCFLGAFVGILLGIPLLKPILDSINALSQAAQQMEGGNYDNEIKIKSSDEIGNLANALEKMRMSIKKYIKQLRKAQDEVIRSEKLATIGKMAGIVSHELRGPLNLLRTSAYFLKETLGKTTKDEKVRKHLAVLEAEVNTSERIISDILTFSRIKKPSLAKTDINASLQTSLDKVPEAKDVEVVTGFSKDLPRILADEEQLCQVFGNIILNGFQAMPDGGKLTITTTEKEGFVTIDIADTGEGISEENLGKIFDPLFSTKRKGTGLGLSTCQSIIAGHKGTLKVESKSGKGAKFIVSLPIVQETSQGRENA